MMTRNKWRRGEGEGEKDGEDDDCAGSEDGECVEVLRDDGVALRTASTR